MGYMRPIYVRLTQYRIKNYKVAIMKFNVYCKLINDFINICW